MIEAAQENQWLDVWSLNSTHWRKAPPVVTIMNCKTSSWFDLETKKLLPPNSSVSWEIKENLQNYQAKVQSDVTMFSLWIWNWNKMMEFQHVLIFFHKKHLHCVYTIFPNSTLKCDTDGLTCSCEWMEVEHYDFTHYCCWRLSDSDSHSGTSSEPKRTFQDFHRRCSNNC